MFWIAAFMAVLAGAAKSASNSRLGLGSGLCFVGVTSVSNRSDSRLEGWGTFVCFVGVTLGVACFDLRLGFGSEATMWCSTITFFFGST